MKTKYSNLLTLAAVGAIALAASPSVYAVATLRIDDAATGPIDISIDDGSGGDINPLIGGVSYFGSLGVWTFVITSGTTKPTTGTAVNPELHLSIQATSSAAGTITFQFSDDGFGPTSGIFSAGIGGALAAGAGVTYSTEVSAAGTKFAGSTLTGPQVFTPIAFSGTANSSAQVLGGSYALTQTITLTHGAGAGKTSSADAVLSTIPDGGLTLSLLGGSMVGLVGLRRKFIRA